MHSWAYVLLETWPAYDHSALPRDLLSRLFQRGQRQLQRKNFVTPLVLAPLPAVAGGAVVYGLLRALRLASGINKELCICIGQETQVLPVARPGVLFAAEVLPKVSLSAGAPAVCQQRYTGAFLGVSAGRLVDAMHFLSAGAVSFARGLNDTP